jgi:hypothetical protein
MLLLGLVTLATQACPTPAGGPEPRVPDAGGHQGGSSAQAFVRGDGGGLRLDAGTSTSSGGTSAWSGGGGSSGQGSSSHPASGVSSAGLDAGFHPDATPVHPDASTVTTQTQQACTVWQDCGPHYGDLNSGFECVASLCSCDPAGQWAIQCVTGLQGSWVALECLCVVSATSSPPTGNPDPNPSDNVQCWWSWHSNGCEPDRWVDTSHYDRVCNPDCRDVWVNSGYWESGNCNGGRWIKRCDDGTEIWY